MNLLDINQAEIAILDKFLNYCFDKDLSDASVQPSNMANELKSEFTEIEIKVWVEYLHDNGYVDKLTNYGGGVFHNGYKISTKGRIFKNQNGFKNEYSNQIAKSLQEQEAKKFAYKKIELEVMQLELNIALAKSATVTNISIVNLNNKTEDFYTKQDGYNSTQKNLTVIIAVATGVYTLFAALAYFKDDGKNELSQPNTQIQLQQKLQQLDSTLQSQIKIDSSFQKAVSDSLKMPQKNN